MAPSMTPMVVSVVPVVVPVPVPLSVPPVPVPVPVSSVVVSPSTPAVVHAIRAAPRLSVMAPQPAVPVAPLLVLLVAGAEHALLHAWVAKET